MLLLFFRIIVKSTSFVLFEVGYSFVLQKCGPEPKKKSSEWRRRVSEGEIRRNVEQNSDILSSPEQMREKQR